jgi:nucleoside-diphosphate-sugar epimerase
MRDLTPHALPGFDAVVHLAALSSDYLGDLNPCLTYDINLEGTVRLA